MKKKFKELKDNQKVLAVFGILGLVLLLTAGTYAFFSYSKEGTTENTLKSGSITFWYDEINQSGNSISIEDALPMTDEAGKQQTQAFNFKIQSTTSSTTTIPYEITLRQKQGTDNIGNIVKVYLAKTSAVDASIASEEEVELSLFSELSNVTKNTYSEKLLHTDIVPASDSPYTQFYRLKMWIDNNTDYSQVENETTHEMEYPYNNKTFTVTVNVYANGHVLDANSGTASIDSVSVGGTELTSTTVGGVDTYTAVLPEGTTQTTISVDTGDYDQVTITKTQSDYTTPVAVNENITRLSNTTNKKVNLTPGENYFKVIATSEDGEGSMEAHVNIKIKELVVIKDSVMELNPVITVTPTLTNTFIHTSDASGLYKMSVTDGFGGSDGDTYYFRGAVTSNYVRFAGIDWQIVRINEDGTIRMMTVTNYIQGSYNSNLDGTFNSTYYSTSTVKGLLEAWYSTNITGANAAKVATGNYFCEAAKAKSDNNWTSGNASMTVYTSYTPNLKCETDGNGKGLLNQSVGLITYDEMTLAGSRAHTVGGGYYLHKQVSYHTMSQSGMNGSTPYMWSVTSDGRMANGLFNDNWTRYYPVINLKANTRAEKQTIDGKIYYVID